MNPTTLTATDSCPMHGAGCVIWESIASDADAPDDVPANLVPAPPRKAMSA